MDASLKYAGRKPTPRGREIRSTGPRTCRGVIDLEGRKIACVTPPSTDGVDLVVQHRHREVLALGWQRGRRGLPAVGRRVVDPDLLRGRPDAADHVEPALDCRHAVRCPR